MTQTLGAIIEQTVVDSFFQKNDDGGVKVVVRSYSSDRYKTITEGPGRLITNQPGAITFLPKFLLKATKILVGRKEPPQSCGVGKK